MSESNSSEGSVPERPTGLEARAGTHGWITDKLSMEEIPAQVFSFLPVDVAFKANRAEVVVTLTLRLGDGSEDEACETKGGEHLAKYLHEAVLNQSVFGERLHVAVYPESEMVVIL